MLSDKLQSALNEQMRSEFYSSYLYLGMAAHFESGELGGIASLLRAQAAEETQHAHKFFDYLCQAGARPRLGTIEAVPSEYGSALTAFRLALEHERKVSAQIHALMDLAISERNHASVAFLQWFVTEQVEEEATFGRFVRRLEMLGDDPRGLLMFDREMAARAAGH